MIHRITINQIAKVGKAPDALARVPEMMDTPPILWFDERKGVAIGYTLFILNQRVSANSNGSENPVSDHFVDVNKMVNAGATHKDIGDIQLSRYACYLIVQNGDPRKKVIALGQSYFAVKMHQQKLIENYDSLDEDSRRLAIRNEMKLHKVRIS